MRRLYSDQRRFWNVVFDAVHQIPASTPRCPCAGDFYVEQFIPHSFVSHDLMWNLIPADSVINSSKSNKLPRQDDFFENFVQFQHLGLNTFYNAQPNSRLLEDYLMFGEGISTLANLPSGEFKSRYQKVFSPLYQIAENRGLSIGTRNNKK